MATGRLIGSTNTYETGYNTLKDYFQLVKFTALATGIVTEIRVYSYASGHVKVAIYADNAGEPGSLITANNSNQSVMAGQWNMLAIGNTNLTKDVNYWLAWNEDTNTCMSGHSGTQSRRYKLGAYSDFNFPDPAGSGFSSATSDICVAGWGILVLSPVSISHSIGYGSSRLFLVIKPLSIIHSLTCGTPAVIPSAIVIYPPSIFQDVGVGMPSIIYPQTVTSPSIAQPIAVGGLWLGIFGFVRPASIAQHISIDNTTILKYVWHVILDSQYSIETPEVNRTFIIGRNQYGNPVYGTASDSTELGLVGERLDFQHELAIPIDSQAAGMAGAILSKMRLSKARGIILIPPNCGQELFDVVEVTDHLCAQWVRKYRVVGMRFEYNYGHAYYYQRLILTNI